MAKAIVSTKRCCHCKEVKPTSDFAKNRSTRDGFQHRCRICHAKAMRICAAKPANRAKAVARVVQWHKTPKGRALQRRQYIKDRDSRKCAARDAVNYQVGQGRLPRVTTLACARCGGQAQHYHHHLGYEPEHHLDVLPVCALCHKSI